MLASLSPLTPIVLELSADAALWSASVRVHHVRMLAVLNGWSSVFIELSDISHGWVPRGHLWIFDWFRQVANDG